MRVDSTLTREYTCYAESWSANVVASLPIKGRNHTSVSPVTSTMNVNWGGGVGGGALRLAKYSGSEES